MATKESKNFVRDSISRKAWSGPVIDLGAGIQAGDYAQFFPREKYIQLDADKVACPTADIVADILKMPEVKTASYGVVLMLETLEHLADPFQAFKEAARILRVGGLFVCTTVAVWALHRHPKDYYRFLPDGLQYLCKASELTPYFEMLDNPKADSACHCCIAAVKNA